MSASLENVSACRRVGVRAFGRKRFVRTVFGRQEKINRLPRFTTLYLDVLTNTPHMSLCSAARMNLYQTPLRRHADTPLHSLRLALTLALTLTLTLAPTLALVDGASDPV